MKKLVDLSASIGVEARVSRKQTYDCCLLGQLNSYLPSQNNNHARRYINGKPDVR